MQSTLHLGTQLFLFTNGNLLQKILTLKIFTLLQVSSEINGWWPLLRCCRSLRIGYIGFYGEKSFALNGQKWKVSCLLSKRWARTVCLSVCFLLLRNQCQRDILLTKCHLYSPKWPSEATLPVNRPMSLSRPIRNKKSANYKLGRPLKLEFALRSWRKWQMFWVRSNPAS